MYDFTIVMFNEIAPVYDFLNNFLSFGIHKYWRKDSVRMLKSRNNAVILDIACGTSEMHGVLNKKFPGSFFIFSDLAIEMLKLSKKKKIDNILLSSAHDIPLKDSSIDVITTAFGLRNFSKPDAFLKESMRVLKPGGELYILEFSKINKSFMGFILNKILNKFVPFAGKLFSGNKKAYNYLMESMTAFSKKYNIENELLDNSFKIIKRKQYNAGLVQVFIAIKT